MAFDEQLATRVRHQLASTRSLSERKMFGGLCFMTRGNMICGILNDELIVRVHSDDYDALLKQVNTKAFDFTGRPMRGFIMVSTPGLKHTNSLKKWLRIATDYATSLLAKN